MSGESLFNVMLSGFVIDGFAKSLVVVELSELLDVSPEEAESYLKGNKKVIKARVDAETAKKYHAMFTSKGVDIIVERVVDQPKPAAAPQVAGGKSAPRPAAPATPANASTRPAPAASAKRSPTQSAKPQAKSAKPTAESAKPSPVSKSKTRPASAAKAAQGKPAAAPPKQPPRQAATAKRATAKPPKPPVAPPPEVEPAGPKVSIADAFSGQVDIAPPSLAYKIKLFTTAAGVGVVAVLYVLLLLSILSFALARFYHMLAGLLSLGAGAIIVFYVLPILLAAVLMVFLLRPVFPRRERGENWFSLDVTTEKTFFRFVQHICGMVGAEKLENINITNEVDAGVDLEGGIKGLKQRRLELWIGIPLIISLSARQLAGIIAREFSRFNRGHLSLVEYLIHEVNIRLYNSVHNMDGWEQWLDRKTGRWNKHIRRGVVNTVHFFARVTGFVLLGFFYLVSAVSAGFLRQREYDADYYNVLISGSGPFIDIFKTRCLAEFALDDFRNNVTAGDNPDRLVNDLPALVFHDINAFDEEVVKHLEDDMMLASTQWNDIVPANRDRIMHGEDLELPGTTTLEIPAYRLLRELKKVCHRATLAYYREHNIPFDPHKLVDVKDAAISSNEEKLRGELCQQYYNGWFAPDVFWKADQLTYARSLQLHQRKKEINEIIAKIRHRTPDFGQLKQSLPKLFNGLTRLRLAVEIQKGGYALDMAAFGLEGVQPGNVQRIYKDAQMEYDEVLAQQNALCEMMGLRLCLAVAFLNDAADRKLSQYLIDSLACLQRHAARLLELKIHVVLIPQYVQRVEKHKELEHKKRLRRTVKDIQDLGAALVEELRGFDWPFDDRYQNLSEYFLTFVPEPPPGGDTDTVGKVGVYNALWNALCRTNTYLNGQIAPLAQRAEKENRIEPVKITAPFKS